jgi:hypothetical protein
MKFFPESLRYDGPIERKIKKINIFLHWPRWSVKLDTTKRPTNFMGMWYSNIIHFKRPQRPGDVVKRDESRIPKKLQEVLDEERLQERLEEDWTMLLREMRQICYR